MAPRDDLEHIILAFYNKLAHDLNCSRANARACWALLETKSSDTWKGETLFNNIEPFSNYLKPAKPDMYHGAAWEQLHEPVRESPDDVYYMPTANDYPVLPNLVIELKGVLGCLKSDLLQTSYYGAIRSRTMHYMRNLEHQQPDGESH